MDADNMSDEQFKQFLQAGIDAGVALRKIHQQNAKNGVAPLDFCTLRMIDINIKKCERELETMK